jgi:hypothetical protein
MERQDIIKICEKYKIKNYTINDDGSIDVDGDVDLTGCNLTELPLIFNKVTGWFDCGNNNLITLKGCPKWIGDSFRCCYNRLSSLEFGPEWVADSFRCSDNQLTSLEFAPNYVGDFFSCGDNQLTDNYCDTEIKDVFMTSLKQDGLILNKYNNATNYKEWRLLQKRKRTLEKLFQKDLVD